ESGRIVASLSPPAQVLPGGRGPLAPPRDRRRLAFPAHSSATSAPASQHSRKQVSRVGAPAAPPHPTPSTLPAPPVTTPAPPVTIRTASEPVKPGWGHGDRNHVHTRPPGRRACGPKKQPTPAPREARLQGWLQTAVADYSRILRDAEQRAAELGSSPRVQSALARRDRRQLAHLAGPNLSFELGRSAESATPGAVSRSVEVVASGRTLGRVIVKVPFDADLLARLERASGFPNGARLAFASGDRLTFGPGGTESQARLSVHRAVDLVIGGERYRAIATFLGAGPQARKLVALAPTAGISGDASGDRWRVIVVG